MRYLREESQSDYAGYHFRYTIWGIPESDQDIETLYNEGYLPYSSAEKLLPIYYLCRSVRVDGNLFKLSSENRRVLKKVAEAGIVAEIRKYSGQEASQNTLLIQFFVEYFKKHGENVMSTDRVIRLLNYPGQRVFVTTYSYQGEILGAIISQEVGGVAHYWFSAYSNNYPQVSLGMWLMITFIQAHADKVTYLGTAYNPKALYKTNIEQVEYFDGNGWVRDLKKLKGLLKSPN